MKLGQRDDRVFVATNVCDTDSFIRRADCLAATRAEARRRLNLPERFTVLYVGELDEQKRPDVLLDLARQCADRFSFVLVGSGAMERRLRKQAELDGLTNVEIPGRVADELPLFYRSADVLLVPGRGGIAISEAMAFGLPVIVHEADGTEYDLVIDMVTGIRVTKGDAGSFCEAIEYIAGRPDVCADMGRNSRRLVETRYTTRNMVKQIIHAAHYARNARAYSVEQRCNP